MWNQVFLICTCPDEFGQPCLQSNSNVLKKIMFIKDQFLSPIFDKSPNILVSKRYGKSHEKKTLNG